MRDENLHNLRLYDNDKYLALYFAPVQVKAQLSALFNFHYEISQVPVEVSEPMIGMIKMQWWRDCLQEIIEGKPPRPHPILRELAHSNANPQKLIAVVDNYEKLLDDWQPQNMVELEEFISNTQVIIFEQAANIMETTCPENTIRAYAYNYMARKIMTKDSLRSNMLLEKSRELLDSRISVFAVITTYYNQNPTGARWKLLLRLAFSRAKFL